MEGFFFFWHIKTQQIEGGQVQEVLKVEKGLLIEIHTLRWPTMCTLLKISNVSSKEVACSGGFLSHHLKLKVGENSTNHGASSSNQSCPKRRSKCVEGCTWLVWKAWSGWLKAEHTDLVTTSAPTISHGFPYEGKEWNPLSLSQAEQYLQKKFAF